LQYSLGSDIAPYLLARHDDTPIIDKETHRLVVANMDWNHIKVGACSNFCHLEKYSIWLKKFSHVQKANYHFSCLRITLKGCV
jgi:hypothetical protein